MKLRHIVLALVCVATASFASAQSFLQQSTASQIIDVGPFVDDTDFKTVKTGLTIANTDVKISKMGGTFASKNSGGCTHDAGGTYHCTLDATDTNTAGRLSLQIEVAGALAYTKTFFVLPAVNYAALFTAAPGAAGGIFQVGTNAAVAINGTAASGATPAVAALTLVGGAASTTGGGVAAPGLSTTGGAGAASTNGAADGIKSNGGGTTTVSGASGLNLVATGNANGLTTTGAGSGVASSTLPVSVVQWTGTNVATPDTAGYPKVTIKSGTGTGEVSLTSGIASVNTTQIAGAAVSTSTAQIGVNVIQAAGTAWGSGAITAGAIASNAITSAKFDNTAGSFYPLQIIDQGTAQAATGTTLQLRSADTFADSELNGAYITITGGTTGVGQTRQIASYVGSTDTATVGTWTTTPTGTITYIITPNITGAAGLTAPQVANAVWDEAQSSHTTSGTTGERLGRVPNAAAGGNGGLPTLDANSRVSANVTAYGGTAGTFASGRPEVNTSHIAGSAVSTSSAQIGVNVVNAGGAAWGSGAITAASIATGAFTDAKFDTTAGPFYAQGVIDQGTAQAASSTTLQLRSAAAFADTEIVGATCQITGGSTGVGQARAVSSYVGSTDTATVSPSWTTTPTGTITYKCFGTAPGVAGTLDATAVENAVWNSARASHVTSGTFGENVIANTTKFGGTTVTGRDIGTSVLLSAGTGTGQISLTSGTVTVGTNNDKTGYTASTVSDKTGYSLTQTFPTNFSALSITGGGAVTAGTVSDKTGYSLSQSFPTNFSALSITGGGAVTAGTVSDKTGYSLATPAPTTAQIVAAEGSLAGTCSSGSTTTCVDAALTQASASQLNDRLICFPTAVSGDDFCAVVSFNPATDTVTLVDTLGASKAAPSTRASKGYVIYPASK